MSSQDPLICFSVQSKLNAGDPFQTLQIEAKADPSCNLTAFPNAPDGSKTVLYADFEMAGELDATEGKELASVISDVVEDFFQEAKVDSWCAPGGAYLSSAIGVVDSEGASVYRVALFFRVNFHEVLTGKDKWLKALARLSVTIRSSGPLLGKDADSAVHSVDAYLDVSRAIFSEEAAQTMPPNVRAMVEGLQAKVPPFLQEKLDSGVCSSDSFPVNLAEIKLGAQLDAHVTLFSNLLRQKVSNVPLQLPETVQTKLGGLKCLRMVAEGAATIDIGFTHPEPVAQCIGVDMGGDDKTAAHEEKARELWDACRTGSTAAVGKLLEAGASPDEFQDGCGSGALLKAALNGYTEIVQLLLKGGAKVDAADESGLTPLMGALMGGHSHAAHALIAAGADMTKLDMNGDCAADVCDTSCDAQLVSQLRAAVLGGDDGDHCIKASITADLDAFAAAGGKPPQIVQLNALVKDGVDFSDLPGGAAPEGTKTVLWFDMLTSKDMSEQDETTLRALIEQLLEAGLAANEFYLDSRIDMEDGLLRVVIFLGMDSFEMILMQSPWLKFFPGLNASIEMSQPLASLIQDKGSQLPRYLGRLQAEVEVHEALLTSDALSTVPEGISAMVPPNVVAMLDNEVPPIQHGDVSLNVSLNQQQLEELFAAELEQATTAKVLKLAEKAPASLTPIIVELTRGLSCIHYRSAGNAAVDMELKPPVPLLDLLPVQDGSDWGEDEETEIQLNELIVANPIQSDTSPQFEENMPSIQRTAEDARSLFRLLTITC